MSCGKRTSYYYTLNCVESAATTQLALSNALESDIKLENFQELVRQRVGSAHTRRMEQLDSERDRLMNMADRAIANGLRSSNPDIVVAANEVDVVRRLYGNFTHRQQVEQTQVIAKLLRDLTADPMHANVELITGLSAMLDAISEINDSFLENFEGRNAERQEVVVGGTLEARLLSDAAASASINAINLLASIYEAPLLSEVINEVNTILTTARHDLAARRRGRNVRNQETEEETVES